MAASFWSPRSKFQNAEQGADGRDAPANAISASINAVCNRCWADQTLDEIKHAATEVLRAGRCVDTALRLAAGLSAMSDAELERYTSSAREAF